MRHTTLRRRTVLQAMAGLPAAVLHAQTAVPSNAGVRVASGESRFGRPLALPEGNPLFIKVASETRQERCS